MKYDIGFFLPTRKGSQRVKNKNTRTFSNFPGGLLQLKLTQLLKCKNFSKIVLSTNDELSIEMAKDLDAKGQYIEVVQRPEYLCLDTTPLQDLINYVPKVVNTEHILWGHVTTPFADEKVYDQLVESYFQKLEEGKDSLVTVTPFRNFLLRSDGTFFGKNPTSMRWPRTQDLPFLYEINHVAFLAGREVYIQNQDRVGVKPYLFELSKIQSFDIDWEEDFFIAEAIYDRLFRN